MYQGSCKNQLCAKTRVDTPHVKEYQDGRGMDCEGISTNLTYIAYEKQNSGVNQRTLSWILRRQSTVLVHYLQD